MSVNCSVIETQGRLVYSKHVYLQLKMDIYTFIRTVSDLVQFQVSVSGVETYIARKGSGSDTGQVFQVYTDLDLRSIASYREIFFRKLNQSESDCYSRCLSQAHVRLSLLNSEK